MRELTKEEIRVEQIQLLKTFDDFCKGKGVEYFLAYGTLLGAVRHQGFIPWDNDIDIFIFRDQAEKLLASVEPDSKYDVGTRPHYDDAVVSRVYFNDTTRVGEDGNHGIYLDGFILDHMPATRWDTLKKEVVHRILIAKSIRVADAKSTVNRIGVAGLKVLTCLLSKEFVVKQFNKLLTKKYDSNMVCILRTPYHIPGYNKSIFEKTADLPFEGHDFPVPAGYAEFLETTYGDYMTPPPVEKRTKVVERVWEKN